MSNLNEVCNIMNVIISLKEKVNIPLLLWGKHGVGKTELVHAVAKQHKMECVVLNLANQTPEDLLGQIDGKGGYHRPSWIREDETPVIYFLDEINRAPKYVLQSMFNFINEGRIHTHKIKDTDIIVAAANPDEVEYEVTTFDDAAFLSRFCHIKVEPTQEEFVSYINKKVKNTVVQNAISKAKNIYMSPDVKNSFTIKPNNRNLEKVALMFDLCSESVIKETGIYIIAGLIGFESAAVIMEIWRSDMDLDFNKIRKGEYPFKKHELDRINIVNNSLFKFIADLDFDNISAEDKADIKRYINFVPKDMKVAILKNLVQNISNNRLDFLDEESILEYIELLKKEE